MSLEFKHATAGGGCTCADAAFVCCFLQDLREVAPGQYVEVGACGGAARYLCGAFGILALGSALFGLISNEADASQVTERTFWIILVIFWGLSSLGMCVTIVNRMFSGAIAKP